MRKRKQSIAWLLAAVTVIGSLPLGTLKVQAATELTDEAYEDMISTYSINDEIPAYNAYLEQNPAVYPNQELRMD